MVCPLQRFDPFVTHALKLLPQPHELDALGLSKTNHGPSLHPKINRCAVEVEITFRIANDVKSWLSPSTENS